MTCARKNAQRIATWLLHHPRIERVYYPGLPSNEEQRRIYENQCSGPGALLSFELRDAGETEAFQLLDGVELIKLAVSLGGTESLIEHPATMTHADVPPDEQRQIGITPSMIRLSVGIEHHDDLIKDLDQAIRKVGRKEKTVEPAQPVEAAPA